MCRRPTEEEEDGEEEDGVEDSLRWVSMMRLFRVGAFQAQMKAHIWSWTCFQLR